MYMGNTWRGGGVNIKLLPCPLKTFPYSLETVFHGNSTKSSVYIYARWGEIILV